METRTVKFVVSHITILTEIRDNVVLQNRYLITGVAENLIVNRLLFKNFK